MQWPLQLVWWKLVLKWIGPEMPRSMITTWTGRQKWNWSSTEFYPRNWQSRSWATCNYRWLTQVSPSSGSGRTPGNKYPLSMPKLDGHVISSSYKLETFWNLLNEQLKPKGNKLLLVIKLWTWSKQGHLMNGWPMYTTLFSYIITPQPPRKELFETS